MLANTENVHPRFPGIISITNPRLKKKKVNANLRVNHSLYACVLTLILHTITK